MPELSCSQLAEKIATTPVLASFPTDTVPALATCPEHAGLIYAAKRRPPEKPLILMGASFADLLPYVAGDEKTYAIWQALTRQHWPGQLTLVLPASKLTPKSLNPQSPGQSAETIGIRVPDHPSALELLSRTGPLATTSANFSGQPPLTALVDIAQAFPTAFTLPAIAFESVTTVSGTPSTVVKWTGQGWQVLRQGTITLQNTR